MRRGTQTRQALPATRREKLHVSLRPNGRVLSMGMAIRLEGISTVPLRNVLRKILPDNDPVFSERAKNIKTSTNLKGGARINTM